MADSINKISIGKKIQDSIDFYNKSKKDKALSYEKQYKNYQKDLDAYNKNIEKQKLENASISEKMRSNFQSFNNKLKNSFSGSYQNNITKPGMKAPSIPSLDNNTKKVASEITSRGSNHILSILRAKQLNVKLAHIISELEYKK